MHPLGLILLLPLLLTPQLGHRSFRVREAAHKRLGALGCLARPALELAAGHPDLEVRRRSEQLRAPWVEEVAEAKSRRIMKVLPWITEEEVGEYAQAYYLFLASKTHFRKPGHPHFPEYREATRLWVKSQILQKRPRREVLEALGRLVAEEARWVAENQSAKR